MGCDIHQYNLIWKDGSYIIEGEGQGCIRNEYRYNGYWYDGQSKEELQKYFKGLYHSNYIPEIAPGRWYLLFGVLAGVRSSEYEIEDGNRFDYYPKEFGESFIEKISYDRHSPTWYYFSGLRDSLKLVLKKMKADKKRALKSKDPDDEDFAYWDEEYDHLLEAVQRIIRTLTKAKLEMGREAFEKSIIFFNFDS